MKNELDSLRQADLNWTLHLDAIWDDHRSDLAELQANARRTLTHQLDKLMTQSDGNSPVGQVLIGTGGSGKTHLLGNLRREAMDRGLMFLSVDMSNVASFWDTVLLGIFKSMLKPGESGRPQFVEALETILKKAGPEAPDIEALAELRPPALSNRIIAIQRMLEREDYERALEHRDVLKAVILLHSTDFGLRNIGYGWLQSLGVDEQVGFQHDFGQLSPSAQQIVKGLMWLLSLNSPIVLAFDQLDNIVREHNLASQAVNLSTDLVDRQQISLSIIEGIAGGLMNLYDLCKRTLVVISCLENTWVALERRAAVPVEARYNAPLTLRPLNDQALALSLLEGRLAPAYAATNFVPPYPTWPIRPEALKAAVGLYPREILRKCGEHVEHCLIKGQIEELASFDGARGSGSSVIRPVEDDLTDRFERLRARFDTEEVLNVKAEAKQDLLIETLCDTLAVEVRLPPEKDVEVIKAFATHRSFDPLHAQLRVIHRDQDERERSLGLRFLQSDHASAFQARLKAAMTASGIDKALDFRRLVLLRTRDVPAGPKTKVLIEKFESRGGIWIHPSKDDLATLGALSQLWRQIEDRPKLRAWIRQKAIIQNMEMLRSSIRWLYADIERALAEPSHSEHAGATGAPLKSGTSLGSIQTGDRSSPESSAARDARLSTMNGKAAVKATPAATEAAIPLGRLHSGGAPGEEVAIPLKQLVNHTVVLAGSGSGKTVFLKRLIEEAAVQGVPSIVIDGANDLARLGDPWPEPSPSLGPADHDKSERYFLSAEVVVFTPGREAGRPLQFQPIPALADLRDTPDEYAIAKELTRTSLVDMMNVSGRNATTKTALVDRALDLLAERGQQDLPALLAILEDPPSTLLEGYDRADRHVKELQDKLRAKMQMDRLLSGSGEALRPETLLGVGQTKTRISVLNFIGIPDLDGQRTFLDQLARILFVWIKKNPSPGGTIRGLLVVDEAKDFVPSTRNVPCKESFRRLAAQARKYGLGLVFATQEPKSIDHSIISNSKTILFGKVNSPAAIAAAQEQLRDRGGHGSDIARLGTGVFYVYSEGFTAPKKIKTSLCLSHHPSTSLTEEDVLARATRG